MAKTMREHYETLIELEHNKAGEQDALEFMDTLLIFNQELKADLTSLDGVIKRVKQMAEEVMVELGVKKLELEHGKVYWRNSGNRKSVDVKALDAIAATDARFSELYLPHRKETEGKRSLIVS